MARGRWRAATSQWESDGHVTSRASAFPLPLLRRLFWRCLRVFVSRRWSVEPPPVCMFFCLICFFFFNTFQMKKRQHAGKNAVNYLSSKMESWLQFHPVYKCQTPCLECLLDVLFFFVFFSRRANVKIYKSSFRHKTTTHWVVASLGCIPPPFSSIYVQYEPI